MALAYGGRSSVGRAPVCGTGCREFEPHRPPHCMKAHCCELFLFIEDDEVQTTFEPTCFVSSPAAY